MNFNTIRVDAEDFSAKSHRKYQNQTVLKKSLKTSGMVFLRIPKLNKLTYLSPVGRKPSFTNLSLRGILFGATR